MFRYRTNQEAPHLVVELEGTVSETGVREMLGPIVEDLASMPDEFVMLATYPNAGLIEADAVRPLFYLVARIFDQDPGLCVFVDGGQSPHPGLRTFINQIGLGNQVRFVRTEEEANRHVRDFIQSARE